MQKEGESLQ
jgi:hypothetical protein